MMGLPRQESVIEQIARVGVMGIIALSIVATVCGLAVYTMVQGIQTETANAYHNALLIAAGGVLVAAGKFFNNDSDGPSGTV